MKPKLFIGSSSESLAVAKELAALLEEDFDVKVWDRAFGAGEYFLEQLKVELLLSDFALFILAPDDKLHKRNQDTFTTRDNVIFELGMFIGALGIRKANFVLVTYEQNGVTLRPELPSDLDGLKTVKLTVQWDENGKIIKNSKATEEAAKALRIAFLRQNKGIAFNLLPSTSLAIGYFFNFILLACESLIRTPDFKLNGEVYDLTRDIFDFNIIIPDKGNETSHRAYKKFVKNNNLSQIEIKAHNSPRTFPFFILTEVKDGRVQLFDLPTTLLSSRETIRHILPESFSKEEQQALELKEIANFKKVLEHLLTTKEADEFTDNIHLLYASDLFNTEN